MLYSLCREVTSSKLLLCYGPYFSAYPPSSKMSILLKVLIIGLLLLVGMIIRASFESFDPEMITALGTLLAGLAAIVAVFVGFASMQQQVRKTTRADWLKMFRIEAANVMVLSKCSDQVVGFI